MKPRPSELIRRAHQAVGDVYLAQRPRPLLSLPQVFVLRALLEHGFMNQTKLVKRAAIDRSSLADLLDRMAKDRLIARIRDKRDQRANLVTITPTGRKALSAANRALCKAEAQAMSAVRPAHRSAFLEGLRAISEAISPGAAP